MGFRKVKFPILKPSSPKKNHKGGGIGVFIHNRLDFKIYKKIQ